MDSFLTNYSLKNYNTFGIDVLTKYFYQFSTVDEIKYFLKQSEYHNINSLTMGGGSNILFSKNFDGIIYYPQIKGIEKIKETKQHVFVKAAASEIWDDFVNYCVINNLCGIENLSNIPGTVGATPVQNIGAYGVEIKDTIYEVEALNIENLKIHKFSNKLCEFAYRNSIFKKTLKNKYIILNVIFKLNKTPNFVINYGAIESELKNIKNYTISDIRNIIINIRKCKLPDPILIGNAGSFFKNPIVNSEFINTLKKEYNSLPTFKVSNDKEKIAAGWLIEQCGWKGKKIGNVGVYINQALVIVNYGNAKGSEILEFSKEIQKSVYNKFGINLETEVNIY